MDLLLDDILIMKKQHPCGGNDWLLLRVGADLRIKCNTCGHMVLAPRHKIEKNIKKIIRKGEQGNT